MEQQEVCNMLWGEIVVDFGHELITAVHTPIAWSDQRPGEEEFKESFSKAKLDAGRILSFLVNRRSSLKRVVLMNSEGYYSEVYLLSGSLLHIWLANFEYFLASQMEAWGRIEACF